MDWAKELKRHVSNIAWPEELQLLYETRKILKMLEVKISDEHKKRIKYLEKILNTKEQ